MLGTYKMHSWNTEYAPGEYKVQNGYSYNKGHCFFHKVDDPGVIWKYFTSSFNICQI